MSIDQAFLTEHYAFLNEWVASRAAFQEASERTNKKIEELKNKVQKVEQGTRELKQELQEVKQMDQASTQRLQEVQQQVQGVEEILQENKRSQENIEERVQEVKQMDQASTQRLQEVQQKAQEVEEMLQEAKRSQQEREQKSQETQERVQEVEHEPREEHPLHEEPSRDVSETHESIQQDYEILSEKIRVSSYRDFHQLVSAATIKVTFWGQYQVKIQNRSSSRSMSWDHLTLKLINLVGDDFEFCEERRSIGREAVSKIQRLKKTADEQLKHRNFFTRLFHAIAHRIHQARHPHKNWENKWHDTFEYYTRSQYQKVFKRLPVNPPGWKLIRCPDRWKA
jgi:myosin heavy subunit